MTTSPTETLTIRASRRSRRTQGFGLLGESAARTAAAGALERATAEAAHDLNNILSVIVGCASELEGAGLDEDQRARVGEIRAAAERGAGLTRDLIDVSRGRIEPPTPQPVEIDAAVRAVAARLQAVAGPLVEVRLRIERGVPRACCGADDVEKLLLNLTGNARDAMPAGGVLTVRALCATVGADDPILGPGPHALLTVSDTGTGMSEPVLQRAREPFFSTKRTTGGGLGLTTVHGIARAAGGDVRFVSEPDRGTCAFVYLPAVRPDGEPLTLRYA